MMEWIKIPIVPRRNKLTQLCEAVSAMPMPTPIESKWLWVHPDRDAIIATSPRDTQPTVGPAKRATRPDGLAHAATVFKQYTHDRFDRTCAPPNFVNIYTPDGGVLRALTEADAARICDILNGEE